MTPSIEMDGVLWIEGLYVDRGPMWIQLACCGRYVDPVSMLRSLKRPVDLATPITRVVGRPQVKALSSEMQARAEPKESENAQILPWPRQMKAQAMPKYAKIAQMLPLSSEMKAWANPKQAKIAEMLPPSNQIKARD